MNEHLREALELVALGVPVLPLREGKGPFGNCLACAKNKCGGRPNMKSAGGCQCPLPCHAWAAATTSVDVITSAAWSAAWRKSAAVAYHPGGVGVTVVDLDNTEAVAWARETLPATRTVPTTRGEHWIYLGTMQSANGVRPGVDIKSLMAYARWLGRGEGQMIRLPETVTGLPRHVVPAGAMASSPVSRTAWSREVASGCRHTERYVRTGLDKGVAMVISQREQGAASQAFGVARFLGSLHQECPGPCALETLGGEIVAAAVSVGVPETYAVRAVDRGFAEAGIPVPSTQMA
ncbi:bifunctional DNA primase/polymerase [Streptomyces lunaelactis]|uniref:bifunctional DNA primase/polymerase n=1 Tax=Streptomyces lunaelactis TaxID=1535768 RepID=UPI001584F277|nr:bifunctional DNA primase/polymerase [Streptomyces lunaelactis]NUK93991.1 bifunctional DNA primase/polymerase [Streptomyces lunaelactis]